MYKKQAIYDSIYESAINKGFLGWGGNERLKKANEQIQLILSKPYVPFSGKILELGCGEGNLCRLFYEKGYKVSGVDISSVAIRWANEKNITNETEIKYYHADFSEPGFQLIERFDLIVDGNCLHCIIGNNRHFFLKNAFSNLSDNGIFFVSSLCSKDNKEHTIIKDGEPYRYIPTSKIIKSEIKKAGFEILDINIHNRDEYNHINLFLRKMSITA